MRFIILTAFLMLLATFKVSVQDYNDIQKAIACSVANAGHRQMVVEY